MVISHVGPGDPHPARPGARLRTADARRDHHAARRRRPRRVDRRRRCGGGARRVTEIFRLSNSYVEELCALDPFAATAIGVPGHDDEVTDYSPDGVEAELGLARRTLAASTRPLESDADRIAVAVMRDRIEVQLEGFEAGHPWRQLSAFDFPITFIRSAFDGCPRGTAEDWEHIATRMTRVPDALRIHRIAAARARHGPDSVAAAGTVCATQAGTLGGERPRRSLLRGARGGWGPGRAAQIASGERSASCDGAYAEVAVLARRLRPAGRESDAAGEEVYAIGVRRFLGLNATSASCTPGAGRSCIASTARWTALADVIAPDCGSTSHRRAPEDPARGLESIDYAPRLPAGTLTDRTIDELNGVHFDIPEQIRRVECRQAPPGTAARSTTPRRQRTSPDRGAPGIRPGTAPGSRSGPRSAPRTTRACPAITSRWGSCMTFQDRLSTFQRELGFFSGHGEGWALYAERLMEELGYLENPATGSECSPPTRSAPCGSSSTSDSICSSTIPEARSTSPDRSGTDDVALPFVTRYSDFGGASFARASSSATAGCRRRRSATRSASACGSISAPSSGSGSAANSTSSDSTWTRSTWARCRSTNSNGSCSGQLSGVGSTAAGRSVARSEWCGARLHPSPVRDARPEPYLANDP